MERFNTIGWDQCRPYGFGRFSNTWWPRGIGCRLSAETGTDAVKQTESGRVEGRADVLLEQNFGATHGLQYVNGRHSTLLHVTGLPSPCLLMAHDCATRATVI